MDDLMGMVGKGREVEGVGKGLRVFANEAGGGEVKVFHRM